SVAFGGVGTSGISSLAGSVAFNFIEEETSAKIESSTVQSGGNVAVTSTQTSYIFAFAGALAVTEGTIFATESGASSPSAAGAGFAFNAIFAGSGTKALIEDSDVTAGGSLDVSATSTNTIYSFAIAAAVVTNGGEFANLAIAISITVNLIADPTEA